MADDIYMKNEITDKILRNTLLDIFFKDVWKKIDVSTYHHPASPIMIDRDNTFFMIEKGAIIAYYEGDIPIAKWIYGLETINHYFIDKEYKQIHKIYWKYLISIYDKPLLR